MRAIQRCMRGFCAITTSMVAMVGACSNSSPKSDGGTMDASASDAALMCPSPGAPAPGPADNHCDGQPVQPTNESSCFAGADADAGDQGGCPYSATMFGMQGDDDDCKYHVVWSSTEICESTPAEVSSGVGVTFTVTVTNLGSGTPVAGIPAVGSNNLKGVIIESFIPDVQDADCDNMSNHPGPNTGNALPETVPGVSGVYTGTVQFDEPGDWTVRFHIHEECLDILDDSPHGHAAFHINVP